MTEIVAPQVVSTPDDSAFDIDALLLRPERTQWHDTYMSADPFPHIVIDDIFPTIALNQVVSEIVDLDVLAEKNFYGTFRKHRISEQRMFGPATRRLIEDMNSAPFLQLLEGISGISGLIPDPYLEGGGVHQIGAGGYLKVHTDFNWHPTLKLHRRLNVLVYLNPEWDDAWNGHLELWNAEMKSCRKRVAPLWNRLVIFSTTDSSYHGHPDPLRTPDGVVRNSIALYYYTADRPAEEQRFGRTDLTNYRARPGEQFSSGRLKHSVHQMLLRWPLVRRLTDRVRRASAVR